jgi:hypothetical protein
MGMPEYAEFLDLARRYEGVHLDTTMAFTDFTEQLSPFPPDLRRSWSSSATGSCSAPTSPTRRTRTATSWRRWSASTSGTTGCGAYCTTTGHGCSKRLRRHSPLLP